SADRLREANKELGARAAEIEGVAERAQAGLRKAAGDAAKAGREADEQLKKAAEGVAGLVEQLKSHAAALAAAAERATTAAGASGEAFRKQAADLLAASEQAAAQAKELEKAAADQRRGSFLASMSLVTSRLSAAGVDLVKAYERHIPEDAWQRYLEGD